MRDVSCLSDRLCELQPDAVINCAAHVGSLHYVMRCAADVVHDNLSMILNLYQAVRQACPGAKVINPISNCSYPGDATVQCESQWWVAVGTALAGGPPRGSVREELPHTALTSGITSRPQAARTPCMSMPRFPRRCVRSE